MVAWQRWGREGSPSRLTMACESGCALALAGWLQPGRDVRRDRAGCRAVDPVLPARFPRVNNRPKLVVLLLDAAHHLHPGRYAYGHGACAPTDQPAIWVQGARPERSSRFWMTNGDSTRVIAESRKIHGIPANGLPMLFW
jgi:hypothetical protein